MLKTCRLKFLLTCLLLITAFFTRSQAVYCNLALTQNVFWNSLNGNTGLSQNSVTSVIQDSRGFIWIGTYDGLNRFDGFATQVKRHESGNPNSLSDNRVLSLQEDRNGNILVGTEGGGLNILNPETEKFDHINLQKGGLQNNALTSLCTDQEDNIWIGSSNDLAVVAGLDKGYRINRPLFPAALRNLTISKLICDMAGNIWIATNKGLYLSKSGPTLDDRINKVQPVRGFENISITALYQDSHHNIWIGENGGLYFAGFVGDLATNELIIKNCYKDLFSNTGELIDISDIKADLSGNLWISSRNAGIFKFSYLSSGNLTMIAQFNTKQPFCNLSEDMIRALFIDRSNTLWAGTYRKGINYFNLSTKNFYSFNPLLSGSTGELGYQGKFITAVSENERFLWIGTYDEGLYQFDKCNGKLSNFRMSITSRNIICLYRGANNTLWIGSDQGLYMLTSDGKLQQTQFKDVAIRAICEDKYGRLWIASWDGLQVFRPESKSIRRINSTNGLSTNTCFALYADPVEKAVWVGTIGGGLNRIEYSDTNALHFSQFRHLENNTASISNNHVWSIYRDKKNVLWVGTDAGLNKCLFDNKKKNTSFEHINAPLLKDRKITSILEDGENNLWLSSSQGLFRYNTLNENTKQYTYKDGLQSNNFTESAFKNPAGRMYFGGINGLNYFEPEKIQINTFLPTTAIVDFKIFNHSVVTGEKLDGKVILEKNINATSKITLSHKQNNFLLTFAALHYAIPEDNGYRYKLEGYDKDWIITGYNQRFAAYSNLDVGEYTFLFSSSNNDGIWNPELKSIRIIIEPAPWFSWWAKSLYLLVFAMLGWFVLRYFKSKHQFKNELFLEKIEKEKVTELNELKLKFFTNITHELRTPLNLITGPIEELSRKAVQYDEFTRFRLQLIHRNTNRLLTLINQVLDLRKISANSETLKVSCSDLVNMLHDIMKTFEWMAEQKEITFRFNYDMPAIPGWFDKDKIEKIIFNLLSNAFKSVAVGGTITIGLACRKNGQFEEAVVSVSDTGSGIAADEHADIFALFYQGKDQEAGGSGIGLAICRTLAEMHHGNISVQSEKDKGACFTLTLPISKHAYTPGEIGNAEKPELSQHPVENFADQEQITSLPGADVKKKTILVVEDDDDQRAYIKECLLSDFDIRTENNAATGFETAAKIKPAIIITDIMMPGMDGIAFTKKLKSDIRTFHIPVIVHSIKNSGRALKEALEAGADDMLTKPFDYHLLAIKINNVLRSRNKLLQLSYKEQLLQPTDLKLPSEQEVLLKTILKLIEENMSDPDFGVEKLARLAAMSRMNLHRKLFTAAGKTASEFIREVRMKRAAQLLDGGGMRISEVMYEIGISSNYHFNKYFKEMHGMSVKDFSKKTQLPPS